MVAEPRQVGPYRLLEVLGEGGMGAVWLAEQEAPIRRRVALKLIRADIHSPQAAARFDVEREALARMDHPHIARVLDAGLTEAGRPYVTMEYVEGEAITEYCDRRTLGVPERLRLVSNVCAAVQHAHQKGVLHRDIKPTNILVKEVDGRPVPKVIDFGLAKPLDEPLGADATLTRWGQAVGTPAYMSPEQAMPNARGVDTRTDVYSLGVVLYELLVGDVPAGKEMLQEIAFDEALRRVLEDVPPKPSTRASSMDAPFVTESGRSAGGPEGLQQILHGDLDWITMKALEKDPDRRYASALDLGADLDRHLKNEPVLAGPPSTAYRLRKFVRRHRAMVAGSTVAALALVVGLVATLLMYATAEDARIRAESERDRADRNRDQALKAVDFGNLEARKMERVLGFIGDELAARPEGRRADDVRFRDVLDRASRRIPEVLGDDPNTAAAAHLLVAQGWQGVEDPERAVEHFEALWTLRRTTLPPGHPDVLEGAWYYAGALLRGDRYGEAEALCSRALDADPAALGRSPLMADRLRYRRGVCRMNLERFAEAEADMRRVLVAAEARGEPPSDEALVARRGLAMVVGAQGRDEESEALWREALAANEQRYGKDGAVALLARLDYASHLAKQGRWDAAAAELERVLARGEGVHPKTRAPMTRAARYLVQVEMKRLEGASPEVTLRTHERLADLLATFSRANPDDIILAFNAVSVHQRVAELEAVCGERENVIPALDEACRLGAAFAAGGGADANFYGVYQSCLHDLTDAHMEAGDWPAAERAARRALEVTTTWRRAHPDDASAARDAALALVRLGDALLRGGSVEGAIEAYAESADAAAEALTIDPSLQQAQRDEALARTKVAAVFLHTGRLEEAARAYRAAVERWEALRAVNANPSITSDLYRTKLELRGAELRAGIVEAEYMEDLALVARSYWKTGHSEKAVALYRQAFQDDVVRTDLQLAHLVLAAYSAATLASRSRGDDRERWVAQALAWLGEDVQLRVSDLAKRREGGDAGSIQHAETAARGWLAEFRSVQDLEALRSDARFQALLRTLEGAIR